MENPNSWGPAERVISEAIRQAGEDHRKKIVGLSLERRITSALREAGLLKEDASG